MEIENISVEALNELPDRASESQWYNLPAGTEHYRLLRYLGHHYEVCADIGTFRGHSAAALSEGCDRVISWDIHPWITSPPNKNVELRYGDCTKDDNLLLADFIMVDIDHTGRFEQKLIEFLINEGWHGPIIADDIYLQSLVSWWDLLNVEKRDISHLGHYTGTGLIYL